MTPVKKEDITQLKFMSALRLSPDGNHAVWTETTADMKKNGYKHDLYLYHTEEQSVRRMTYSGNNADAVWDDAETLLFPSERREEDKPAGTEEKAVFYRLNIHGGEAHEAFTVERNVTDIRRLREGIYVMEILTDRYRPDTDDKEILQEEQDYHVVEEVPFWGNGRGYIAGKRSGLWLYTETDGKLTKITEEYENVEQWEVQDSSILYISRTYESRFPMTSELKLYNTDTKEMKTIVEGGKLRVDFAVFAGETVVYGASDMKQWRDGQLPDLFRWNPADDTTMCIRNEEELSFEEAPISDASYGGGQTVVSRNGSVFMTVLNGFRSEIYRFTPENTLEKMTAFDGAVKCFDTDGSRIFAVAAEKDGLPALWCGEKELEKALDPNEEYLKTHAVAKTEYIPFRNEAGMLIDGWVIRPVDFDENKTYPGILEIHGGPRGAYGEIFFHEMQQFAAEGFIVFFCNPRGGSGRGEAFADLRGKYGTIDYRDLMDFTDHVLACVPQLDPERLGACGGSYGGFMCNWIEGHTDRFAAIVSQRSISNWVADFGSSEIGVTFDANEMGATPWKDMEKMWEQSPLKYADRAKTPILFIHSLCDYNCTVDQGAEMFTAMKYFGVPSRMVLFEGENHSLSRSGKPKHRLRRLKEMNDWFRRYMMNEKGNGGL